MRVACEDVLLRDRGYGHRLRSGRVTYRDQSGELFAFSRGKQGRRGAAWVCVRGEKRPNSQEGHDSDIADRSAH